MPKKARSFCSHVGCPEIVSGRYCPAHMAEYEAKQAAEQTRYNKGRGSAASNGYDLTWRKARIQFLSAHPLCAECLKSNTYTPAAIVDHVAPHKGDMNLFWDKNNWQGLCKSHHDTKTAKEDGRWKRRTRHD